MNRITTTTVGLMALACICGTSAVHAQSQSERIDTARTTSLAAFGTMRAEVGIGVAVNRQIGTARDERAFIPVQLPGIGDTILIDKAELTFRLAMVPETTLTTAMSIRTSPVPETTLVPVYETTTSPAISVFPSTVPAESRTAGWSTDWEEMTGGFDPEFVVFTPVTFEESDLEVRVDVTEIVRQWASGGLLNHGFVVKAHEESKSAFRWIRDADYDGKDAKLEIYYSRNPVTSP